jgi:hypothetical protein
MHRVLRTLPIAGNNLRSHVEKAKETKAKAMGERRI